MYAEITAALSGIKTVGELTALILKTKVDSTVTEKAIESQGAIIALQNTMLTLQTEYQSLLQEKDRLEKLLIDMDQWETEAQKYQLTKVGNGAFVYALKADQADSAPEHWLCTTCYQQNRKSILQMAGKTLGRWYYECPKCQTRVVKW